MLGTVYKSTGSWYLVKTGDGKMVKARIKGIFKIDNITSTNPIAVGDEVTVEPDEEGADTMMISGIAERKNYIARSSPHNQHQHHIIAANLNQTMLFATLREPRTSSGFIDRFLVSSEAFHVPAILIFNKWDLYKKKEQALFEEWKAAYTTIGYEVMALSMQTGEGLEKIQQRLQNKTTLLSGHSGVGKSTFINAVLPETKLRTTEVSNWSGKGMHTTTFAQMFDLPFGGCLIDTPGIREFGVIDISKEELSHYFPEMRRLLSGCRYNNCLHINEPDCAVKEAVNGGKIYTDRYVSYLNIMDSLTNNLY